MGNRNTLLAPHEFIHVDKYEHAVSHAKQVILDALLK